MIHLTEVEPKGSDMYRCYFSISNKEQHIQKCIKCVDHLRKCNIAHEYQNLYTHVRHCHKDYKEVIKIFLKAGKVRDPLDVMLHHPSEKAVGIYIDFMDY